MIFTQRISTERLPDLDFQKGDTLRVLNVENTSIIVQVIREETTVSQQGKAREWLASARGTVKLAADETVDDVRMEYYACKYGPNS